jgi:hypothetical protein
MFSTGPCVKDLVFSVVLLGRGESIKRRELMEVLGHWNFFLKGILGTQNLPISLFYFPGTIR